MDKIELSYEQAVNKLEELLVEIESDDLKLEDTLEKFKEAMDLYKCCNAILTNAEGTVKQILEKEDGFAEINFPSVFREENNEVY
ncbi:MAG: exodeoxyribonuclease VII small subunit [Gudongella sp.]|nr:exodeoxyribonuclease VII small subunit [Gudongella sp.]